MNKKVFISLSIVVFVVVIAMAGGYYFYKNPIDNDQQIDNNQQSDNVPDPSQFEEQESNNEQVNNNQEEACQGDECKEVLGEVIDGVIKKMEEDYIEVERGDNNEMETIILDNETSYFELTFDSGFNFISEKEVEKKDIKMESDVSISVYYTLESVDKKIASGVKSIIVSKQ